MQVREKNACPLRAPPHKHSVRPPLNWSLRSSPILASVTNGSIGRSSHHGIHGNGNVDISLRDLTIQDHEVAGISLNGPHRLLVKNVVVAGHSRAVLARATLSASRYLLHFFNSIHTSIIKPHSLVDAMEALQVLEVSGRYW